MRGEDCSVNRRAATVVWSFGTPVDCTVHGWFRRGVLNIVSKKAGVVDDVILRTVVLITRRVAPSRCCRCTDGKVERCIRKLVRVFESGVSGRGVPGRMQHDSAIFTKRLQQNRRTAGIPWHQSCVRRIRGAWPKGVQTGRAKESKREV